MASNRNLTNTHPRGGWVVKGPLVALGLIMISAPLIWSFLPRTIWKSSHDTPLTAKVIRGDFINEVTERGDVESASNVEVRCEVETQGSGIMIIRIVPEGTYVQPGDFLVELDSSALRDQYVQQQIKVANEQALLTQAQRALDTALIAKQEYLEGQYRKELLSIQIENFVAEENRRRAEDYLKYSQSLAQKGYITQAQLEADQFALNKAIKELEAARTKLDVLERFTKVKMLKQLDADIETARAKLEAQQHSYQLQTDELKRIEEQIKKCTITAPTAGQVVYANQVGVRGQTDIIIQEGVRVRQYQTIIRLPDPKRMQVRTKVNESKIGLVRVGLPAKIRVDALTGVEFDGEVTDVGEYPLPTSFFNSNVKDYQVIVKINNPTEELRGGLTAQVTILARREPNVLQVPVQSVFEVAGEFYCIKVNPDGSLQPVKVEIGPSNEKFIVIRKGLEENEEVVLNAASYRAKVGLAEKNQPVLASWTQAQGDQATAAQNAADQQVSAVRARQVTELSGGEDARFGGAPGEPHPRGEQPGGLRGEGGPPGAGFTGGWSGGPPGEGGAGARSPGGFNPAMIVDRIFERMDANKDGKLDPEEIPEDRRAEFMQSDTNGDGGIDKQELLMGFERMRASGNFPGGFGRRGGPEGRFPRPGDGEAR